MLIGFQKQKDGSPDKALLYINSTVPWVFEPEKLLGMLKELVSILETHLTKDALDVAVCNNCGRPYAKDGYCDHAPFCESQRQ